MKTHNSSNHTWIITILLAFTLNNVNADLNIGITELVSVNNEQQQGYDIASSKEAAISGNGRYIAFVSSAYDLLSPPSQYDIFIYDNQTDKVKGFNIETPGDILFDFLRIRLVNLSSDGRIMSFVADFYHLTQGKVYEDIYWLDTQTSISTAIKASRELTEFPATPQVMISRQEISTDGQRIIFKASFYQFTESPLSPSGLYTYHLKTQEISPVKMNIPMDANLTDMDFSAGTLDIAFVASNSLLVESDTFGNSAYVYNQQTQTLSEIGNLRESSTNQGYVEVSSPSISANGNIFAFSSNATNLVAMDNNGRSDTFVYNKNLKNYQLVDLDQFVKDSGVSLYGTAYKVTLSNDGNRVAFIQSYEEKKISGETKLKTALFLYQIDTQKLTLISDQLSERDGFEYHGILQLSDDGSMLIISSLGNLINKNHNQKYDLFRYSVESNELKQINLNEYGQLLKSPIYPFLFDPSQKTKNLAMSGNGRYVLFAASSKNFDNQNTNLSNDLFLRDNLLQSTKRITTNMGDSRNLGYTNIFSITQDGHFVIYCFNYHKIIYRVETQQNLSIPNPLGSSCKSMQISGNGEKILDEGLYSCGDSNCHTNAYYGLYNITNNTKTVYRTGQYFRTHSSYLSPDSNYIAYSAMLTYQDNYSIHLYHIPSQNNTDISSMVATDNTKSFFNPVVSENGTYVAFDSDSGSLGYYLKNDRNDVYLYDGITGKTKKISNGLSGEPANGPSYAPSISSDGRYIAYYSHASNLVNNDTNQKSDIFVYDRVNQKNYLVSITSDGEAANANSFAPLISADGNYVSYSSSASNLTEAEDYGNWNIFRTHIIKEKE